MLNIEFQMEVRLVLYFLDLLNKKIGKQTKLAVEVFYGVQIGP